MSPQGEGHGGVKPQVSQNVIVLSKNFTPTQIQMEILNRGLQFIPTMGMGVRDQQDQMCLDLQKYHRRISLATYFKNDNSSNKIPFSAPSIWEPPRQKLPMEIGVLMENDYKVIKKYFKVNKEKANVSKQEIKAIKDLMRAKHIVIKPADKGSSVVILDREQYILEVTRQLQDKKYYKKLDSPIYLDTIPMIQEIIDRLKTEKFINFRQAQYLKGLQEPRERLFYILPKVHKPPEKWTIPFEVPPGRPIVSDCGSETYATAEFIDYFLNPLSTLHSSYVKDTYHFIEIVQNLKVSQNCYFFSLDVDSLYTNIDITAGLETVRETFIQHPDPCRPDQDILKLLEINLRRNDFLFNSEYFLQIKGTAMGKRFAPSYANIFMAHWEERALAKCTKKPLHYLRYLDDIWGVWEYSLEDFQIFLDTLNSQDASIQLKSEINQFSIDFLDTTVYKGPEFLLSGKLDVKVFFKVTDTHALLFKSSFHPKHVFKGIVKSQLLRFYRICTQREEFWKAVKILFQALKARGYGRSFLRRCLHSFKEQKLVRVNRMVPLISQFSSLNTLLHCKFKRNFDVHIKNTGILKNHDVISAYRKNKNLKDYLVRAKLKPLSRPSKGIELENFCSLKIVKNSITKKLFEIKQVFSPQTKNVVYLCFCTKCNMKYVGETRNSIQVRMWQHRYNVRNKKNIDTPFVKHFILHSFEALRVAGLQSNLIWTSIERRKIERQWIYWLGTREPHGLNVSN